MNHAHRDYWKWVVLKQVQNGSYHSAGAVCRQFDRAGALKRLINSGHVSIFGSTFNQALLTLTHSGIELLKELDSGLEVVS